MSVRPSGDASQRFERAVLRFELCLSRFEDVIDQLHAVIVAAAPGSADLEPDELPESPQGTAVPGPKRRRRLKAESDPAPAAKRSRTKQSSPAAATKRSRPPLAQDAGSRAQRARALREQHENDSDNRESEEN